MKETIGATLLGLALGLIIIYFIARPLVAIGDIPNEIKKLRDSIDNLSEIIKNRGDKNG